MSPIFEWDGDHPALNFVNTLDERLSAAPLERLAAYADVVAFAAQAKLIDAGTAAPILAHTGHAAAERVWKETLLFREAIYRVALAYAGGRPIDRDDLAAANRVMGKARAHRRLTIGPRRAELTWDEPAAPERPLWELAASVEDLFVEAPTGRLRKCQASDCGTLFLDTSKTGRRIWCSMANCGNRSKIRRFRAGQAAAGRVRDSERQLGI